MVATSKHDLSLTTRDLIAGQHMPAAGWIQSRSATLWIARVGSYWPGPAVVGVCTCRYVTNNGWPLRGRISSEKPSTSCIAHVIERVDCCCKVFDIGVFASCRRSVNNVQELAIPCGLVVSVDDSIWACGDAYE
jgi:hypothetical protein